MPTRISHELQAEALLSLLGAIRTAASVLPRVSWQLQPIPGRTPEQRATAIDTYRTVAVIGQTLTLFAPILERILRENFPGAMADALDLEAGL